MERIRGPINSFIFGQNVNSECSFLQKINGSTQSELEEEELLEDKRQVHFQINQRILKIQHCIMGPKESIRKKKRKRSHASHMPTKNAEELESQRMNHIVVERNRRQLMNSYLNTLRSLLPSSFGQQSDQASIIAGAINFVKELEQLLLSLQSKKRTMAASPPSTSSSCVASEVKEASNVAPVCEFLNSPQYTSFSEHRQSLGVDVEATVVQGHANLKVVGRRRRGQLVRAIAALEEIGLTVMHLNVTSLDSCSVLYSLNLKVEEECKLGSADEIATVVHQIFCYISATCDRCC